MRSDRIYPVPVKPRSAITTWDGWPEDVRAVLHWWNGGYERPDGTTSPRRSLSFFSPGSDGSIFKPSYSVYRCSRCEEFCEGHGSVAHLGDSSRSRKNQHPFCDDCIIDIARADVAPSSREGKL